MVRQSVKERWLHLRWCHYYQWKNLLVEEQEARRQLELQHQQQMREALSSNGNGKVNMLVNEQLVGLVQLRAQQQQKRIALGAIQNRQMDELRRELAQEGMWPPADSFDAFSALRQP